MNRKLNHSRYMDMKTLDKFYLVMIVIIALSLGYATYFLITADGTLMVEGEVPPPISVGIDRGDTLWDIAKEFYPGQHTGKVVEAIRKLNPDVDPGRLQIGQIIQLPREV